MLDNQTINTDLYLAEREYELSKFSTRELEDELKRRTPDKGLMQEASEINQLNLNLATAIYHYGHNVDITNPQDPYCSDCEKSITL